jgi:hypothetical protein
LISNEITSNSIDSVQNTIESNDYSINNKANTINDQESESTDLSIIDLFSFMKSVYNTEFHTFRSSPVRDFLPAGFNTTVATAQALAILKMSGLYSYIITDLEEGNNLFDSLGSFTSDNGFKIHNSVLESSISGTYGVILSAQLLDQRSFIRTNTEIMVNYFFENFRTFGDNLGGFFETYDIEDDAPISTTYYAVHSLSMLNYDFNDTLRTQITNLLIRAWNQGNKQYFADPVGNNSEILSSFQALSTLLFLNQSGSINISFLNEIKINYPVWISSRQTKLGPFIGGFNSTEASATTLDTGSVLATLYLLENLTTIDVPSANNFLINSQYLSSSHNAQSRGGFSSNNSTHSSSIDLDVRVKYTFYAILGLYSSGYFANNTEITLETEFSRNSDINDLNNEIIIGNFDELYFRISLLNYRTFRNLTIELETSDWDIDYNKTNSLGGTGYEFVFMMENRSDSTYNWTLGEHFLDGTHSLINFTIVPSIQVAFSKPVNIRLPFSSKLNDTTGLVNIKPGDFLMGEVIFDNDSIEDTGLKFSSFGNISVELIYPNNTEIPLNNGSLFELNLTNRTFAYNFSIIEWGSMGDYFVNLTYYNGSEILAFSQQKMELITELNLTKIVKTDNSELVLYPGEPYDLNFSISYTNGYMAFDPVAYAYFIEKDSGQRLFSVSLEHLFNTSFRANITENLPKRLFMGEYNVSIEFVWNSTSSNFSFNNTITNSDLPKVRFGGVPVFINSKIEPIASRSPSNSDLELFYGDILNFTASLGIGDIPNNDPILLEENTSILMQGLILDASDNESIQSLSFYQLNQSFISFSDEINPNVESNSSIYFYPQVKLDSTSEFVDVYKGENNSQLYRPELLVKGTLEIDENIEYLSNNREVFSGISSTIIVNFKVISKENNLSVNGLNLNANFTRLVVDDPNNTQTTIQLPNILPLKGEETVYQLQILVPEDLPVGEYNVSVTTETSMIPGIEIGKIPFSVVKEEIEENIPIENFLASGILIIALITTIIVIKLNNSREE